MRVCAVDVRGTTLPTAAAALAVNRLVCRRTRSPDCSLARSFPLFPLCADAKVICYGRLGCGGAARTPGAGALRKYK